MRARDRHLGAVRQSSVEAFDELALVPHCRRLQPPSLDLIGVPHAPWSYTLDVPVIGLRTKVGGGHPSSSALKGSSPQARQLARASSNTPVQNRKRRLPMGVESGFLLTVSYQQTVASRYTRPKTNRPYGKFQTDDGPRLMTTFRHPTRLPAASCPRPDRFVRLDRPDRSGSRHNHTLPPNLGSLAALGRPNRRPWGTPTCCVVLTNRLRLFALDRRHPVD